MYPQRRNPVVTLLKILILLVILFCMIGGCTLVACALSTPVEEGPVNVPSTVAPRGDYHS